MQMVKLHIRYAKREDAEGILNAHYSAVHQTASKDYPSEITSEWSPTVTKERIKRYLERSLPNETTLVALVDNTIAGFGAIVESTDELRAVYVNAEFSSIGVGSRLLGELEKIAVERGCKELRMDPSLTAAPFYRRFGYIEVERGQHTLRSGKKMACVKMFKPLI